MEFGSDSRYEHKHIVRGWLRVNLQQQLAKGRGNTCRRSLGFDGFVRTKHTSFRGRLIPNRTGFTLFIPRPGDLRRFIGHDISQTRMQRQIQRQFVDAFSDKQLIPGNQLRTLRWPRVEKRDHFELQEGAILHLHDPASDKQLQLTGLESPDPSIDDDIPSLGFNIEMMQFSPTPDLAMPFRAILRKGSDPLLQCFKLISLDRHEAKTVSSQPFEHLRIDGRRRGQVYQFLCDSLGSTLYDPALNFQAVIHVGEATENPLG